MSEYYKHSINYSSRSWFVKHPTMEQGNNFVSLQDIIRATINEAMAGAPIPQLGNNKPISQKELAQYLNVSERTIMRWREKGDVPYLQLGSRVLYQTSEVVKALTVRKK